MTTIAEPVISAVVERKVLEADGVVSLVLRAADGSALPAWHPGAHIDLVLDGLPTRQYSLCGDPADLSTYRVGILREAEGGGVSIHVHDTLAEGDPIGIGGPRNHFRFVPAPRYIFVAGGIGLTPMLPMIAAAEAAGADWTLHDAGRSRATMAFLPELAAYGDRVRVWAKDEGNRLDLGVAVGEPADDTLVYTCGPERLLAELEERTASWPHGALHLERFAAKPLAEPERKDSFEIVLAKSGRTFMVPPSRSILSVVEEAGVGVLSSCATGTCGTCDTPVLEGIPEHRDAVLTEDERAQNDCMMICVSRSLSERLVLNL